MRTLPDSYRWVTQPDGEMHLRERWSFVGVARPDGTFRMGDWPVFKYRQAATQRQACRFMQAMVLSGAYRRQNPGMLRGSGDRERRLRLLGQLINGTCRISDVFQK